MKLKSIHGFKDLKPGDLCTMKWKYPSKNRKSISFFNPIQKPKLFIIVECFQPTVRGTVWQITVMTTEGKALQLCPEEKKHKDYICKVVV